MVSMLRSIRNERTAGRSVWREFGLGLVLMILFFTTWIAHLISEWQVFTDEQLAHGDEPELGDFVSTFAQSTLENWQSEFLQLFTFVVLAALYIHKGSAESKDGEEKVEGVSAADRRTPRDTARNGAQGRGRGLAVVRDPARSPRRHQRAELTTAPGPCKPNSVIAAVWTRRRAHPNDHHACRVSTTTRRRVGDGGDRTDQPASGDRGRARSSAGLCLQRSDGIARRCGATSPGPGDAQRIGCGAPSARRRVLAAGAISVGGRSRGQRRQAVGTAGVRPTHRTAL